MTHLEALKQVKAYLERVEHLLPETQDSEEIAAIVIAALREEE